MFVLVRRRLATIFDTLDGESPRHWLERMVVLTATAGFLLHLLVVIAVRNLPGLPETVLVGLDRSLLHAIYTPFSVILFYEVLELVFALAASHTGEISKQYQIISLIVVRRVFKDIGSFENIAQAGGAKGRAGSASRHGGRSADVLTGDSLHLPPPHFSKSAD